MADCEKKKSFLKIRFGEMVFSMAFIIVLSYFPRSNGIQSSSGVSSATSTPEEQEAKLKAEKIKLAIEKIKEANIKKIFIKVFTSDGSAKSLLVDEKMSVSHVTRILAEKNHVKLGKQTKSYDIIKKLFSVKKKTNLYGFLDNF